ncbi:MAG: SEC-C domain-containing protein [Thermoleophilaceae bacterium]|nr:SEC-C domain-containing protein [Thermoleophilaceae bacterium]
MKREPKVPVDAKVLVNQYVSQCELLRRACIGFDEGNDVEALNIALRLRVLLHDTGNSKSLLGQLQIKDRLPYVDTLRAEMPEPVISIGSGLCLIEATLGPGSSGSRYKAPLAAEDPYRQHPPQAFVDWWREHLLASNSGKSVSRADFVLWLTNEAGGAHVDPSHEPAHLELSSGGFDGLQVVSDNEVDHNLLYPTVRQIAYELETSLSNSVAFEEGEIVLVDPICSLPIDSKLKLGRNDQCPCGSGKKYKLCFLKRRPRRKISIEELYAEMDAAV